MIYGYMMAIMKITITSPTLSHHCSISDLPIIRKQLVGKNKNGVAVALEKEFFLINQ